MGLFLFFLGGTLILPIFNKSVEVATDSINAVSEATQQVVTKTSEGVNATKRFAQQTAIEYYATDSLYASGGRFRSAIAIPTWTDWVNLGFFGSLLGSVVTWILKFPTAMTYVPILWGALICFIIRTIIIVIKYHEHGAKRVINEICFRAWSGLGFYFAKS